MMIPEWKAMALILGWTSGDMSSQLYNTERGVPTTSPILAVALQAQIDGRTWRVLVDTGFHDAAWVTEHVSPSTQSAEETVEAALKNGPGWTTEQVDIVINTHLHYDHCGNNALFPHAKFVVSRIEWETAFHPCDGQKFAYLPELFGCRAVNYFQWQFVDGQTEILPGLQTFMTPGHTPGHMSVLVNTASDGVVCITGDECNRVRNITENTIGGLFTDADVSLRSFDEIRMRADRIIPGHDPMIKQFQSSGFPRI